MTPFCLEPGEAASAGYRPGSVGTPGGSGCGLKPRVTAGFIKIIPARLAVEDLDRSQQPAAGGLHAPAVADVRVVDAHHGADLKPLAGANVGVVDHHVEEGRVATVDDHRTLRQDVAHAVHEAQLDRARPVAFGWWLAVDDVEPGGLALDDADHAEGHVWSRPGSTCI